MSFSPYPAYKDSGVPWLGQVPDHWDVIKLKYIVNSTNAGEVIDKTQWGGDKEILYTCALHPILSDYLEFPEWKRTTYKDLLLTRNGTPYVHKPVIGSIYTNVVQRVCISRNHNINYIAIALQNSALNLRGHGVSIESLNYGMWAGQIICVPKPDEQRLIAEFLDRETGKLDSLVTEQEILLTLLDEKRAATITHAVTRGLDPTVPLRNSGVKWIGQLPEHWKISRLKHIGVIQGGAGFPEENQHNPDELLPFFKVANLGQSVDGRIIGPSVHSVSEETASKLRAVVIPARSIVYAKIGAALLLNRRRLVEQDCCIDNNMTALTVNEQKAMRDWVFLWMQVLDFRRLANPGPIPSFSEGAQRDIPIALPPFEEQEVIGRAIIAEQTTLETLATEARASISLLRERRAALISAAVTGRIDVRGTAFASRDAVSA